MSSRPRAKCPSHDVEIRDGGQRRGELPGEAKSSPASHPPGPSLILPSLSLGGASTSRPSSSGYGLRSSPITPPSLEGPRWQPALPLRSPGSSGYVPSEPTSAPHEPPSSGYAHYGSSSPSSAQPLPGYDPSEPTYAPYEPPSSGYAHYGSSSPSSARHTREGARSQLRPGTRSHAPGLDPSKPTYEPYGPFSFGGGRSHPGVPAATPPSDGKADLGGDGKTGSSLTFLRRALQPSSTVGQFLKYYWEDKSGNLEEGDFWWTGKLEEGPRDACIQVMRQSSPLVPSAQVREKHYVHAFAVARKTFEFAAKTVAAIKGDLLAAQLPADPSWPWPGPLKIFPYHFEGRNAYFSSEGRLEFGVSGTAAAPLITAESFDIVGHETGHAVHYVLNPRAFGGAAAEFFGSIMAMSTWLSIDGNCMKLIQETKGDLETHSSLTLVAERLGRANGVCQGPDGTCQLRSVYSAIKVTKLGDVNHAAKNQHVEAEVFLSAVWRAFALYFKALTAGKSNTVQVLSELNAEFAQLLLFAIIGCKGSSLGELANRMLKATPATAIARKHWSGLRAQLAARFFAFGIMTRSLSPTDRAMRTDYTRPYMPRPSET